MRRSAAPTPGVLLLAACVFLGAAKPAAPAGARETFAVDYIVTAGKRRAEELRVRWELSGAEEIDFIAFSAPAARFSEFSGSGSLEVAGEAVRWLPRGPYGHLEYSVRTNHPRGAGGRFDSYAGRDWLVARARDIFPRARAGYTPRDGAGRPRARARLLFRLPRGWKSAAPYPAAGEHTYAIRGGGQILNRPRGWLAAGELRLASDEIDGVMVRIALAPEARLPADEVLAALGDAVPRLRKMFRAAPDSVLIVSAGNPMWQGGLSAFRSFFLHADRPMRTPDKTSPVLHELFHVMQPFRVAPDADWIAEGLAEYYSLDLQQRAGSLTAAGFGKGLASFARHGMWNVDLTAQHDNAATNNSAPLVMHALDRRIQQETAGKRRLDDVVAALAESGGVVDTRRFRDAVQKACGKKLAAFFKRHVIAGEMPEWQRPER